MRSGSKTVLGILIILIVLTPRTRSWCAEYVMMRGDKVNLRTGPGLDRAVVARAAKGDLFELIGETDSWYEIVMFTGDHRFMHKFWALEIRRPRCRPGGDGLPGLHCPSHRPYPR
jgi:SH3-like domain-containing protein